MLDPMTGKRRRLLIIKLGALGDFVQATAAFADIRAHEVEAEITLATTPAMRPLAEDAPFFDEIVIDRRLPLWRLDYLLPLIRDLRGFDMVYDLQAQGRTTVYWRLLGKPSWAGVAPGCSHPHTNPERNSMHGVDIQRDLLTEIGVATTHAIDIRYAAAPLPGSVAAKLEAAGGGRRVALLPGSAPRRPEKRWPGFGALAAALRARGDVAVLVGAEAERALLAAISAETGAIDLCGALDLNQLVTLFGDVDFVVGNDTGPMHLAAAAGAAGLVIIGPASDARRHGPRSERMKPLVTDAMAGLSADDVLAEMEQAGS